MIHQIGQIVEAFIYPQTKEHSIGLWRLEKFQEYGSPYVLDDQINKKIRPTYKNEIWDAVCVDSTEYPSDFKKTIMLRTLSSIGKSISNDAGTGLDRRDYHNRTDRFDIFPSIRTDIWTERVDGSETQGHAF